MLKTSDVKNETTVLFVDDEENILSSLKRLFRGEGYRILSANSGESGLEILESEAVDLIISDMRMPGMDGATFLAKVSNRWPETIRILLTGFSDLQSTVKAVNEGEIFRYISKPWDDNDIRFTVRNALQTKLLQDERDSLIELTRKQNAELKELNNTLEEKVEQRTKDVHKTHDALKKIYFSTIRSFSSLIELRAGAVSGHSKNVADLSRSVAKKMGLEKEDIQQVYFAGLLHDIGKVVLSDEQLNMPYSELTFKQRQSVEKHPVIGEGLLMGLWPIQEASKIIRHHHERFDGIGYPDNLMGDEIPIGSRILAVANDYDALKNGSLINKKYTSKQALDYIREKRGAYYDPAVVNVFIEIAVESENIKNASSVLIVKSSELEEGMRLARDLFTKSGMLVITEGVVLDSKIIEKIQKFSETMSENFNVYIDNGK